MSHPETHTNTGIHISGLTAKRNSATATVTGQKLERPS